MIFSSLHRGRTRAIGVAVLAGFLLVASAGPSRGETPEPATTLFEGSGPIQLILEARISTLKKKAASKPELQGRLHYIDGAGGKRTLDVTVSSRGKSRLKICTFPPLRLQFQAKQIAGTPFEGHKKLKMVTHCRPTERHRTYLLQESLIYQALQELTEISYRTRFVDMTYVDLDDDGKELQEPAFLIENASSLSARTGLGRVRTPSIRLAQLDPDYLSLTSLFQYMIANTDWSVRGGPAGEDCCHNGHVFSAAEEGGAFFVVPYDFDYAGLIDTYYAQPSESAKIDSVRQRFYRGYCQLDDRLPATIRAFDQKRPELEKILASAELGKRLAKRTRRYLDDFYDTIHQPKSLQRKVLKNCKPE